MDNDKESPLHNEHIRLGARMVDFQGWSMPVQYSSIIKESLAVRKGVGIFDTSHMGEAEVKGAHAHELLQYITSNDLLLIEGGQAQYTTLLNEEGGIIDDLLVYKVSQERYFLCLNASNTDKDISWIADQALQYPDVEVKNLSRRYGMIALQGPESEALLNQTTKYNLSNLEYYHFTTTTIATLPVLLSRTGYTGEDGFEIFCDWRDTPQLWKELMTKGKQFHLTPVGLGARDALRLEMGYALYGQDIDETTTPYEAGLGWVTRLAKEDGIIGCETLLPQQKEGVQRKLVGIAMIGRGIPRAGYSIMIDGQKVGEITSGTMSPTLGKAIALGYVQAEHSTIGTNLDIDIRGKMIPAVISKTPFVESRTKKPVKSDNAEVAVKK